MQQPKLGVEGGIVGKKVLAFGAIVVAIILLIVGLIFLIAANSMSRFLTAVAFLAVGGLLVWYAIGTLRRIRQLSPDNLEPAIVDLARRLGGEVSVSQVQAEFKINHQFALETLEQMRQRDTCQLEPRGERTVYLFKGVIPAKAVKRCPYCGSEFAIRSAVHKCPNCGGNLEITKV